MNIKCPNCQTSYQVPDDKVGSKPKKMRCSRCKEVFTVKRRSQETPLGYEEFLGQNQSLPREFSFLRQTDEFPAPVRMPLSSSPPVLESIPPELESVPPKPKVSPPPVPKSKAAPAPPDDGDLEYEDFFDAAAQATSPFDTAELGAAKTALAQTREADAAKPAADESPAVSRAAPKAASGMSTQEADGVAPQAPAAAAGPATPAQGAPVSNIFGGSLWETEAPLDLGNFAVPNVRPSRSQLIGKIMGITSGLVFLLFMFVIYRNGWTLSLSELPDQFAFAFSGEEYEALPPEVEGLEPTLEERRIIDRGRNGMLLSVVGTVFNNSPVKRREIILKGRLLDANGEVREEVRLPCDKVFEDTALKRSKPGMVASLYRQKGGVPYDCVIPGESSALYQLVFENVPDDYDETYTVKITPVFAR
jgi:predicted Zn finger-like uncharacterized protein